VKFRRAGVLGAAVGALVCCTFADLAPTRTVAVASASTEFRRGDAAYTIRVNRGTKTALGTLTYALQGTAGENDGDLTAFPVVITSGTAPPVEHGALRGTSKPPGFTPGYTEGPRSFDAARLPPGAPPAPRTTAAAPPAASVVGALWDFWVDTDAGWTTVTASLRARSKKAKIWVPSENYSDASASGTDNLLTASQIWNLAAYFDRIYELETPLFGVEYGGDDGTWGIDTDECIHILVYDIDGDYTPTQEHGTAGYFWDLDERTQGELDAAYGTNAYHSNEAEIFYLDAHFFDAFPTGGYSTLVHEFQHMIHYNQKWVTHGVRSATWFNEMLSMVAEDLIDPLIGIPIDDSEHPVSYRMPYTCVFYSDIGVGQWPAGNLLGAYGVNFAFGAFLARNYGGALVVRELATNAAVNFDGVTAALRQVGYTDSFYDALLGYGKALISRDTSDDAPSFNKTAAATVGGVTYIAEAFDIREVAISDSLVDSLDTDHPLPHGVRGPVVYTPGQKALPPYGVLLQKLPLRTTIPTILTATFTQAAYESTSPPLVLDLVTFPRGTGP
jgi:hypothetical protein